METQTEWSVLNHGLNKMAKTKRAIAGQCYKAIFILYLYSLINAYRLLVGKPEGRRPLGRPRLRWVDNIRMDPVEVGWGDVDWIGLAQDRDKWRALVNSVLNLRVPQNAGKLSSV
jgi:hypothetical protein